MRVFHRSFWKHALQKTCSSQCPRPPIFLKRNFNSASSSSVAPISVPVIDFGAFASGDVAEQQRASKQLAEACSSYGFFYIVGHGYPEVKRKDVFERATQFFDLDLEEKKKIPIKSGGFTRGYVGAGGESGSTLFEWKEAFSYGYRWEPEMVVQNPLQGCNEWPAQGAVGEGWRQSLEDFYSDMMQISATTTKALSLSLGHAPDHFSRFCKHSDTISLMRMFHYLPADASDDLAKKYIENGLPERVQTGELRKVGSSEHTDWGFLTLILQDNTGGLEVFYDNRWWCIAPVPGGILVNCGDYLSMMTNGKFVSPLHRVSLHPHKQRLSMVLFYYPDYDAKLLTDSEHSLSVLSNQRPGGAPLQLDPSLPFGAYIMEKWDQVFRSGGSY